MMPDLPNVGLERDVEQFIVRTLTYREASSLTSRGSHTDSGWITLSSVDYAVTKPSGMR